MTQSPQQFGKYRILSELGRGGFATVYRAVDTTLDREVALKILHPQLMADPTFVQRFHQEARTLAALRHPQIITVYEVGESLRRLFIAVELAHGLSLAQSIAKRKRVPWSDSLDLLKSICTALEYAHAQGVIHRDLKPANILLDKQRGPLLTDFGFARLVSENSIALSISGGVIGTPGYIAPEIWEQNATEAPADIYALGCIVYEMLTGAVLFGGQTPMQAMRAHDRGPVFPKTWPDDVPPGIVDVLNKALARDPAARYPTAMALWRTLNALERQATSARKTAEQAAEVGQWRAEAERALAAGELSVARMAIGRWLALAPDDAAAKRARLRLEQMSKPAPAQVEVRPTPKDESGSSKQTISARNVEIPRPSTAAQHVPPQSVQKTEPSRGTPSVARPAVQPKRRSRVGLIVGGILAVMLLACIATLGRGRTPPAPAPTAAPAAAPTAAQPTDAIVTNLKVTAQDTLKFEPATLSAPANGAITVTFKNAGAQQHNWVLTSTADADRIATEGAAKGGDATGITGVIEDSEPVAGGRSKYIGFTIPTAGTYIYLCTIPGHYQAGMKGILTVN